LRLIKRVLILSSLFLHPSITHAQTAMEAQVEQPPTPLPTLTSSSRLPLPPAQPSGHGPYFLAMDISAQVACGDRDAWVITSASDWAALWSLWVRGNSPTPDPYPVDFGRSMVLGICMGTVFSGGYSIRITTIEETDAALVIFVQEDEPGAGCLTTQNVNSPYALVALRRTPKPVQFVVNRTVIEC
jgi:hypothetical protein